MQRIFRVPILTRVLVGNSVIIVLGAVCGTILTRHLAIVGDLKLIVLFSFLGIAVTLLVNYVIIQTAFIPLHELQHLVDQVREEQTVLSETPLAQADPDIRNLVTAINLMLERLDTRTQQLHALSARAIRAQEEERKRVARLLHDDTAQSISTLIIYLERLEAVVPEDGGKLRSQLIEARSLAIKILEDLRKNIWDLRPSILDDLGLIPAIRWFARTHLEEAGIRVEFDIQNVSFRLLSHLETMLFRISQEALNNVLRHAEASTVTIRLRCEDSYVCFEIEDDGRGFEVGQTASRAVLHKQFGLLGIQERASLVGGEIKVTSTPGRGTRLQVIVPVGEGDVMAIADTEEKLSPQDIEVPQ